MLIGFAQQNKLHWWRRAHRATIGRMVRSRAGRWLRVSASAAILAVSAVVALLWLRNFWWADVGWTPLPGYGQLTIASADGQIEFSISYPNGRWATPPATSWGWQSYTASQNRAVKVVVPWKTVVRYRIARNGTVIVLPHWLLYIAPLLAATVPWIRWSRRFTIRTMLVAMTLIAVLLAMIVTAGE
jgi:hypothetical protein